MEQVAECTYHLYLVSQRLDKNRLSEQASGILKGLYGRGAEVSVTYQEAISPESSGKFCLAKTAFPVEIEHYLDGRQKPG